MPIACSAYGCSNTTLKVSSLKPRITFHRFPALSNKSLLEKWVINIRRRNFQPTKYSRICSLHFEENCFIHNSSTKKTFLKKDAVPTIFCFNQNYPYERQKFKTRKSNLPLRKDPGSFKNRMKDNWKYKSKFISKRSTPTVQSYQLNGSVNKKYPALSNSTGEDRTENRSHMQASCSSESNLYNNSTKVGYSNFEASSKVDSDNDSIEMNGGQDSHASTAKITNDGESSSQDSNDRESVFGKYIASEMRILRENPLLYLQTTQAILEILTCANFDLIYPEED